VFAFGNAALVTYGVLMPPNPSLNNRIEWMPSPPLAPDETPLDAGHLGRMTLGDGDLQREVLRLFVLQSARLVERLSAFPPDAAAIAHTLKGSARGIGASSVAACAERVERALGDRKAAAAALAELKTAVSQTVREIGNLLR
jgi:HPt (histidine-containing phosphotransfer) domain-containing protein